MTKPKSKTRPSHVAVPPQTITLSHCRKWMFFSALMIALSGMCLFFTPMFMVKILHILIIGVHMAGISVWAKFYQKVKRDVPFVTPTYDQVAMSPFKSKFVRFLRSEKSGCEKMETVAEPAPSHWWTSNAARDEIQELGRK